MRFRIPPQHKETATIVRQLAHENNTRQTIATDVVCMIQPYTSGIAQRDATQLRSGVPMQQAELVALLSKPNPAIQKGDFLVRASDSSEFRIVDILQLQGSAVMRLYLRNSGVL